MHEAVLRATSVVEEMRGVILGYEGCFCGAGGDIDGDGGVGGKGRTGTLGRWIGMILWSLREKDKVEGMKNEVIARIVEINMLLSLKRYACSPIVQTLMVLTAARRQSEVSETEMGLITNTFQVTRRPVDSLDPSPAYHAGSVASTEFCGDTANDDVSSSDHHGKSPISFFSSHPFRRTHESILHQQPQPSTPCKTAQNPQTSHPTHRP